MFGNNAADPIAKISTEVIDKKLENWPASYYEEKEAVNRLALLEEAIARKLPTYEDDLKRRELWDRRYERAEKEAENFCYDKYMRSFFNFRHIAMRSGRFMSEARKIKDIKKELSAMGYLAPDGSISEPKELVHDEIEHMAKYYLELSLGDKQYNSVIWGFGTRKKRSVHKKLAKEFYEATDLISQEFNIGELMDTWNDALLQAFKEVIPDWSGVLEELSRDLK